MDPLRELGRALLILGAVSVILWFMAVHDAVYSRMTSYGLVSLLGWAYFLGLGLLVTGLSAEPG